MRSALIRSDLQILRLLKAECQVFNLEACHVHNFERVDDQATPRLNFVTYVDLTEISYSTYQAHLLHF
jgi:hypothetical protein